MKINKKLLPVKGHYFLFNAGTAPLVPYLSTYARQLGFSSATVGIIYTVLPIFGLVAKPVFGVIADKYLIQKTIFILFQILTLLSFFSICFLPENRPNVTAELNCGDGVTVLKSCFQSEGQIDQCKITALGNNNATSLCDLNCHIKSEKMWEEICEHWHIPEYCYHMDFISYNATITNVTSQDGCTYFASNNVTLDGLNYVPRCNMGDGHSVLNEQCQLNCTNEKLSAAVENKKPIMTCVDRMLNFKLCSNDSAQIDGFEQSQCEASCDLRESYSWPLMEICDGWGADAARSCLPNTKSGFYTLPKNLSFIGTVLLSSAITEHECFYIQLNHIQLPDGSIHYPTCVSKIKYEKLYEFFQSTCDINCDNSLLNELFAEGVDSKSESQYTALFWLFFLLMILSWVGQAVVVTFADAICFNILGEKVSDYGKQRLWGSIGFGIFSLVTGSLIDVFSSGTYKDYTVAFVLMIVFMSGDIAVSSMIKTETVKMSYNILSDVKVFLSTIPTVIFMIWTIAVGLCTGLLWNFLFWHLEDIARLNCNGWEYIKTLQGIVSAIQTFCGETPFMFISGAILKKVGHINMMSVVLFAFGVRFVLYSFLTNPWWVLPIELLQGITFGMFYPTMTSYASVVSPDGTETTVQGLVGAIFEGVGTSLGSFIGGRLFETQGGWNTFLYFGCISFVFCFLHIIAQRVFRKQYSKIGLSQGKEISDATNNE